MSQSAANPTSNYPMAFAGWVPALLVAAREAATPCARQCSRVGVHRPSLGDPAILRVLWKVTGRPSV
ncbi:MAG: hypothetical protein WCD54_19380, partial [Pseudolabrys sp.]